MANMYINKSDREAAEILHFIYQNEMMTGGCLARDKDGEEDLEEHEKLVLKIESLFSKLRYQVRQ